MPTNRFAWVESRLRAARRATFAVTGHAMEVADTTTSELAHRAAWDDYWDAIARRRRIYRLLRACETGALPPKGGTR